MKMFRFHINIFHDFFKVSIWKFSVKPINQSSAFLSCYMIIPNFLWCIICSSSNSEFYKSCVKVKIIYFIIYSTVLTVSSLCSMWSCFKISIQCLQTIQISVFLSQDSFSNSTTSHNLKSSSFAKSISISRGKIFSKTNVIVYIEVQYTTICFYTSTSVFYSSCIVALESSFTFFP